MRTEAVNVSPRGVLYCPLILRARRLAPSLALAAASAALTVLAFEAAFRLLHVPVGTVQINRATVRRSANPRLLFELRSGALALGPDLVVVAFCLNDLEGVFSYELGLVQDRTERRRNLVGRAWDALLPHSVLLSWIEYRLAEAEARRAFVRARDPLGGPHYQPAGGERRQAPPAPCSPAYACGRVRGAVAPPSRMGHRIAAHAVRDALCDKDLSCGTPG